jgi:hypothetical protein
MARRFSSGMAGLAVFLCLWLIPSACTAGCLGPITVCSSFERSDIAFRGRIVSITPARPPGPQTITNPDGSTEIVVTGDNFSISRRIVFDVLETFRGNPGKQITVEQAGSWTPAFEQGHEYLIFAFLSSGTHQFVTSSCTSDHELNDGEEDADLSWLRAYPTSDGSGFISGHLYMPGSDRNLVDEAAMPAPLAIKITGKGIDKTLVPLHDAYRIDQLPPGAYTLMLSVPAGILTQQMRTVTLAPKSCAQVNWMLSNDSHISGTITDITGKPVANVEVTLVAPYPGSASFAELDTSVTTDEGHYNFAKVPRGDYYIALHPFGPNANSPYLPLFYPASSTLAGAQPVHIETASNIENINLTESDPLTRATVYVSVMRQDGAPVIEVRLLAIDVAGEHQAMVARADGNGLAAIQLYVGRQYSLVASTSGVREPACGGPVTFTASDGLVLEPMKLDKTWNACRAAQRDALHKTLRPKP